MDLGTALALGYDPTGYPQYGQNSTLDWSQVSGGFGQPFPPEAYYATPQRSLGYSLASFPQPLPVPGMPRRVAFAGAPAAAPQPQPQVAPEPAPQPQENDIEKQLGGWQLGQPFKVGSYYSDKPEKQVTVRSFEPGKPAVVEGIYGREIVRPDDPEMAQEYQMIANRFSQLNDLYKQYQAQQGGYQLTPSGVDPMVEQGYNYRVNLGGRELPFKIEGDAAYIYDQGKRRQIDWTDIDPQQIKPITPDSKPIDESLTPLRRNLGRSINDPLAQTEAALSTGFASAPYQSSLIENVGWTINSVDEKTGQPNIEFQWKGPGPEPAGYLKKVKEKWEDDVTQLKANAANFARGLEAMPESVVNNYLAGIDQEIASLQSQAGGADAGDVNKRIQSLAAQRDQIAKTRIIPVSADASILESMPQGLRSGIDPNKWEGMLTLGSGLGWEDQRTGGSTGAVFTTDELAKRAVTRAAIETPLQTTATDLSGVQRTVNPMLKEIKRINEEGVEEFKSEWANVSQQPATFTYEYNGEDVVVQKPIGEAISEFNSAIAEVRNAVESGDPSQIAYAKANLDAKGRLFSGTITPPGGLSTRSIKNGDALSRISTNFAITEEDRAARAGRIYGGSIMPKLTPPQLTVLQKPARAAKEPKRYVPAYPGVVLGNTFIPRQSQTLFQAITSTDETSKFAAAALSPARAQSTGQKWLADAVLDDDMSGMNRGQEQRHKAIIEKTNAAIAKDTPASAQARRSITQSALKQLENMGIKVPSEGVLLDSLENIYRAAKDNNQQELQRLVAAFQRDYLDPNSAWQKTVYDKFKNSGIGSRLISNIDSTTGWQSTNKGRRLQKVPALFESMMNRLEDTLYLYRNSGLYQNGIHTRQLTSEVGSVPIRWIVNPWDQSQQSIATFPSAANQIGESVLQGGKDVVTKINNKQDPEGAVPGKYDPAASFGIATLNDYSPTVRDLRTLFSVDPSIEQDIRSMTKANHQTDMKARNSLRDNADALTNEPAYDSSLDAYLEAMLGASIMPRNRIFNR